MFLKSKKQPAAQENAALQSAKAQLVEQTFGGQSAVDNLPPLENLVVLLWLFRDNDKVTGYLSQLIETVRRYRMCMPLVTVKQHIANV